MIGTHALLQEHVQFADLGLVVIDEQHRFGVEQRDALRDQAGDGRPHVLVMTATPIPRTVAMTVFGDLDISTLTELPAGRQAIDTHVVPAAERPHYLARTWERIREEVASGRQAYVVCPRIGDGIRGPGQRPRLTPVPRRDRPGQRRPPGHRRGRGRSRPRPPVAVLDLAAELASGPLAGLRLAIMHGRLPAEEKDRVMLAFAARRRSTCWSPRPWSRSAWTCPTPPSWSIMDAERFGVSQLHQLRGRVGRGAQKGLCLLVTEVPEDGGRPGAAGRRGRHPGRLRAVPH